MKQINEVDLDYKHFFSNAITKSLVTFAEKIINGKLHFFVQRNNFDVVNILIIILWFINNDPWC